MLTGLDLEVKRGEFLALMGPSGSGKSTLLNLIGGLDRPSSGTIEIGDDRIDSLSDRQLAHWRSHHVGFVFQFYNLLGTLNAERNVELPLLYGPLQPQDRLERAAAALERVGLADRMSHLPNELSGGERQRVAIARALVNQPSLLLADEPTGNLDSRTSAEIMGLFDRLAAAGTTIMVVTHDREVAAHARREIRMRDGRIV